MAKKENKYKDYGLATQAIHTGTDYDEGTGAVRRPLHMANSYKLPDDLSQVNYSSTDLLMYSRNGNPNQHWLEEKIAALHEADDAIVLASGVAALHALFWTLLKTGDRVVYPKVSYMAVYRMFHELFNRKFGVETVMVDMTDLETVKKAITPGTRLVHIETPDNPTNGVTDIEAIAKIAHENGAVLSVDNTFASPFNQKPLQLGADFVVEALTKFINGYGGVISFGIDTDDKTVEKFCAALKIVTFAVSLGHDERLIFQNLTYNLDTPCCNPRPVPVLLIMTSNAPDTAYKNLLQHYQHHDILTSPSQGFRPVLLVFCLLAVGICMQNA